MEIKQEGTEWYAKKSHKAKRWERVTDIIKFEGDLASVMGKAGMTDFHSYLGLKDDRWLEMYGTTSVLNYWGEKERLLQWAVDCAVDYLAENRKSSKTLKIARRAHVTSLEAAGAHGTDKHALVEILVNKMMSGDELGILTDEQLRAFVNWSRNFTFLASEQTLYSHRLWVAGTTDFIVEIDGLRYIGDLKTSNYVKFTHFVQCGAYALMYEEMGLGKIDGVVIAHMPRSGGFNYFIDTDVTKYKMAFEGILQVAKMDKEKTFNLYGR